MTPLTAMMLAVDRVRTDYQQAESRIRAARAASAKGEKTPFYPAEDTYHTAMGPADGIRSGYRRTKLLYE